MQTLHMVGEEVLRSMRTCNPNSAEEHLLLSILMQTLHMVLEEVRHSICRLISIKPYGRTSLARWGGGGTCICICIFIHFLTVITQTLHMVREEVMCCMHTYNLNPLHKMHRYNPNSAKEQLLLECGSLLYAYAY